MITLQEYEHGFYILYVDNKVRIESPYLFEERDEVELIVETRDGKRREIEWHIDHIPEDEQYYDEIMQIREKLDFLKV
ncbi:MULTISPECIES: hypothetical protein [Klebsiella]|uniref:hypothetical protein n=1 Tax=Klebsiella TaxID=570 RepID=UPI000C799BA7|nr:MULTISPECIES: hypothetical protein [Klebsiella]MCP2565373.1 hypothetical protein [Klebsiella pneumoniae]MCQ0997617.1 hypothetical protein [Klebsiella pneumoniae]MCQ1002365.1 hypothetical protein [Klebsiella pneumoniae]PLE59116.1 hypothetical protein B6I74_17170 [Klebsiella variicola]PXL35857.1 hypothetical protein DMS60_19980 [Klebsiella variicola]